MPTQKRHKKYLDKAIEMCGGVTALARTLKVHQTTVSQWKRHKLGVDWKHVNALAKLTGHKVTREQLRPDIFCQVDGNIATENLVRK